MITQFEANRMIIRIPARDLGLSVTEKAVLIALVDRLDSNNVCFPSQSGIAEQVGCTRQSVNAAIAKMVKLELIDKKARVVDGQKRGNYYTLNLPKITQITGGNVVQMDFRAS